MNRDASKAFLCPFKGCERGFPGNEFPRQWNLRDHMKRVHNYSPNPPSSMPIDSVGHETYLNIEKHTRSGLRVKICGLEYLACSDFGSSINIMSLDFATTCNIAIRKDEVDKRHVTTPLGNKSKSVGRACVACSLVSESGNRAAKGYWFYVLAQSSQDLILGKPFLQDFELLRCLQKSPHGTVEEVRHKTTLASMARKTLSLSPQNTDMARKRQFLNEVTMLHKLKRWSMVHIVKLEGMYASNESLTLLMSPAANCNLEDYMAETAKTSLPTKRRLHLLHWQSCLLSALACLHKHKINHKDISPTNILIKGNEILLSGFGLAVSYESNAAKSTQSEIEGEYFSCTSMYCAPEVAKRTSNGLSADVFSMGCVLLEMSTIIHGMRMKDMKEGQADNSDSKAYHCILESTGRWIDRLTSESRNAMQIWESVLGRENCKEYVVAVRRRLNVIRAMLSESPSNRPAAAVLIPLFDTKSFLAVRDSYSPGCDCKPTAFRRKSPPDSMPPQKNTRILKSNAFARTKSRDSLSTIKLEVQDTRRSVVTLPKRDLEARTADRPTSFFNPPKLSSDETEDSLEDRTVAGGEFCALQATGFY